MAQWKVKFIVRTGKARTLCVNNMQTEIVSAGDSGGSKKIIEARYGKENVYFSGNPERVG